MTTMTVEQALALALQQQQAGNLQQAEQVYRDILRADPNQPEALYQLGRIAYGSGYPGAAGTPLTQAPLPQPNTSVAHNRLGVDLLNQGKSAEAATCFEQALRLDPDYAEAHYNLGIVYAGQGKLAEAVVCYEQ